MKSKILLRKISVILSFSMIVISLMAQEQQSGSGYVPQVGQRGKDVVWVPTPQELVDKMLDIAQVTPSDFVIDLGSGDGRTVITAAKLGAKALGIEYNPDMVALSKENAKKAGVTDKAEFMEADLYTVDLSKATVITMFLLPEINLKLRPALLDLKPGTRIVSNTFTMGEWEEDYKVTTDENWNSWNTAYMWIIPAKVAGSWKLGNGELDITQEFQMVRGTFKSGGKTITINDGRLRGDEITFAVNNEKYTGKVNGDSMLGTMEDSSKGSKSDWMATKRN
ncbi:MAG: class I SAM-dependent methyltransferase [Bacteroidales bacterium]